MNNCVTILTNSSFCRTFFAKRRIFEQNIKSDINKERFMGGNKQKFGKTRITNYVLQIENN